GRMAHDPNDPQQAAEAAQYEEFMKRVGESHRARIELDEDGLAVFNAKGELESFRSTGEPGPAKTVDEPVEFDAVRGIVYLFRWEKNDFANCEVHVSCPKCFTLSKHSLNLFTARLQCPQ